MGLMPIMWSVGTGADAIEAHRGADGRRAGDFVLASIRPSTCSGSCAPKCLPGLPALLSSSSRNRWRCPADGQAPAEAEELVEAEPHAGAGEGERVLLPGARSRAPEANGPRTDSAAAIVQLGPDCWTSDEGIPVHTRCLVGRLTAKAGLPFCRRLSPRLRPGRGDLLPGLQPEASARVAALPAGRAPPRGAAAGLAGALREASRPAARGGRARAAGVPALRPSRSWFRPALVR